MRAACYEGCWVLAASDEGCWLRRLKIVRHGRWHVWRDIPTQRRDLAHQRTGDMSVSRIRQHEHRFDPGQITVNDCHGGFVRNIHLGADSLNDHSGANLRAVVDQEADAPARHPNVASETGLANSLLDQCHALGYRKQRGLARVVNHQHVKFVEQTRRTFNDVEVPEGDRVKRPRNNGDPVHDLTLPNPRYGFVTAVERDVSWGGRADGRVAPADWLGRQGCRASGTGRLAGAAGLPGGWRRATRCEAAGREEGWLGPRAEAGWEGRLVRTKLEGRVGR